MQRLQGPFDVHAVLEDAIEHQVADLVVVEGPGEHALGGVAEGRAAIALGLILATGDLQIDDGLVGDGADQRGVNFRLRRPCLPHFGQGAFLGAQ